MRIVLVHGLGVSHRYFSRLRRVLVSTAPDLAGSSVDALTRSLEAHLSERSLLVANSLGCQVSAELAVRRPDLVAGILLIGPTWDPAAPTMTRQVLQLVNDSYREPPSLLPVLAWEYAHWGPRRILRTARSALRHPVHERLAEMRAPAVVVRGEHDTMCSERWGREAAAAARAPFVQVPGAAHALHWSDPVLVAQFAEELREQVVDG